MQPAPPAAHAPPVASRQLPPAQQDGVELLQVAPWSPQVGANVVGVESALYQT